MVRAKKDRKYVSGWIFPKTVALKKGTRFVLILWLFLSPESPSLKILHFLLVLFFGVFVSPVISNYHVCFLSLYSSTPSGVNVLVKFIYFSFFFVALSFLNLNSFFPFKHISLTSSSQTQVAFHFLLFGFSSPKPGFQWNKFSDLPNILLRVTLSLVSNRCVALELCHARSDLQNKSARFASLGSV